MRTGMHQKAIPITLILEWLSQKRAQNYQWVETLLKKQQFNFNTGLALQPVYITREQCLED